MPRPVTGTVGAHITARFGPLRFGTGRFGAVATNREQKNLTGDPKFYRHQPATEEYVADVTHTEVEQP